MSRNVMLTQMYYTAEHVFRRFVIFTQPGPVRTWLLVISFYLLFGIFCVAVHDYYDAPVTLLVSFLISA